MEYLNTTLWGSFPEQCSTVVPEIKKNSRIYPISEEWQREKCAILGVLSRSPSKHPTKLTGQPLRDYKPHSGQIRGNRIFFLNLEIDV